MTRLPFARRLLTRLLLPALGLAVASPALAADSTARWNSVGRETAARFDTNQMLDAQAQDVWNTLDTNADGKVSRQEFNAYHPDIRMRTNAAANRDAASARGLRGTLSASNLIGRDLRNRAGEDIGEIHDLLVNVDDGRIQAAVVSFGGVFDVGDELYRYPLSSFTQAGDGELVLDVDRRAVRAANGFDRDDWPHADAGRAGTAARVWRASRLIGRDIEDRRGDHLGEIEDLIVDARAQRVQGAVMKYDRPWSLDNPLVAVPLATLNFGNDRERVSMNVDRHRLDDQLINASDVDPNVVVERWLVIVPDAQVTPGDAGKAAARTGSPTAASTAATDGSDRLDANRDGQSSTDEHAARGRAQTGGDAANGNRGDTPAEAAATAPAR